MYVCSDFIVKIVDIETNEQKVFTGHEAPILSVSLHPDEQYVVSMKYIELWINRSFC